MSYDGSTYMNYADTDSLAIRVLKNTNNIIYNGTNYLTKTEASSTYATATALTAFQSSVASTYLTIANASTIYLTIANASSTYTTLTDFNAFKTSVASTYLTVATASSTYLTKTDAANTYLTKTAAASTYATASALSAFQTSVASTYLTIASASSTYLTISNATSTYQPKKVTKTITYSGTVVVDSIVDDPANASMVLTSTEVKAFLDQLFIDNPNSVKLTNGSRSINLNKYLTTSYLFSDIAFAPDDDYSINFERCGLTQYVISSSLFSLKTNSSPISPNNVSFVSGFLGTAGTNSITISYEI